MGDKVVILGARGSVPVSGREFNIYGGATTSVFLSLAGEKLLLDAGTGLLNLPKVLDEEGEHICLLLSHCHVDHVMGLPMCGMFWQHGRRVDVYGSERCGWDVEQQVRALMSPPLWPIGPEGLAGKMEFHRLENGLKLGDVTVETLEGVHPGGVTLMRLTGGGKRVVFATDCTVTEALRPALMEFTKDCDLLLIDGQYSDLQWPGRESFGHSTWAMAAQLGRDCGAKEVRIIHHDPSHTDAYLDAAAAELTAIHPRCFFAREGEEIKLI